MDPVDAVHAQTRLAYNLAAARYHELFHEEMNAKPYDRSLLDSFAGRFAPGALVCDAGCGPSAHIGRILADKGLAVVGVDISDRCVEMAAALNPGLTFRREDIMAMSFANEALDGLIAYYSIIHSPKASIGLLFREFHRVLGPGGSLLVAVKAGSDEGYVHELLGLETDIYYSFFHEKEVEAYFVKAGFILESLERRPAYDFEITNERIFAVGRKAGRSARRNP